MSPERTQAYRRVVNTLNELGPSKLQPEEQDRIRTAADTMIFSTDLSAAPDVAEALHDVEQLCEALVDSGRWEPATAARLLDDVVDCGPTLGPRLVLGAT